MKNEKPFEPMPEQKEMQPKSHEVSFDEGHFGDINEAIGTHRLVGELNDWWEKICSDNGINPEDRKFKNAIYYLIELSKNALEYADGGKTKVIFEKNKITVMVSDNGQGFEDLNETDYCSSPQYGHGLSETRKFADEFIIETNGKKYTKIKGKRKLADEGESEIKNGTKITFVKYFK